MDARVSLSPSQSAAIDLNDWMARRLERVEAALGQWVTSDAPQGLDHGAPAALVHAMRYAVLDGGKRLRPLLVLAASEGLDGHGSAALRAACAVELIHAYSLVHDDMPCMDNDDSETQVPFAMQARFCHLLARAAGSAGMAGGQAIDLASVGFALSEKQLRDMHELKTGALLKGSVLMGAACGRPTAAQWLALEDYGAAIGLAFQVVDDILDVTADSATLGKTAGKDAAAEKPTYVSVLGLARSRAYAGELLAQALAALGRAALPHDAALRALADMVVNRSN